MALMQEDVVMIRGHVAVHEAAHAVAALEQQIGLTAISMSGGDSSGHAFFTSFERPATELMAERPDDMAPVVLAGTVAEHYFFDGAHVREGYAGDVKIAMSGIDFVERPDLDVVEKILRPWVERAREIVRERCAAIETVAVELMTADGLSRDEVVALVERSMTFPRFLPATIIDRRRIGR